MFKIEPEKGGPGFDMRFSSWPEDWENPWAMEQAAEEEVRYGDLLSDSSDFVEKILMR